MESTGKVILPTYEEVIEVNRIQYEFYGGTWAPPDNLKNPDALRGILEYIQDPPVVDESFVGVLNIATRYAWHIIRSHYFHDGNKRTGMHVLVAVLDANGFYLRTSSAEIEAIGLRVADQTRPDSMTLDDLRAWVHSIAEDRGANA